MPLDPNSEGQCTVYLTNIVTDTQLEGNSECFLTTLEAILCELNLTIDNPSWKPPQGQWCIVVILNRTTTVMPTTTPVITNDTSQSVTLSTDTTTDNTSATGGSTTSISTGLESLHSTESSTTMPPASSFISTHVTNDTSTKTTIGPMSPTGSTATSIASITTDTTTLIYTSANSATSVMPTTTPVITNDTSQSVTLSTDTTTDNTSATGGSTTSISTGLESLHSTESSTTMPPASSFISTHVTNDTSTKTTIGPMSPTGSTATSIASITTDTTTLIYTSANSATSVKPTTTPAITQDTSQSVPLSTDTTTDNTSATGGSTTSISTGLESLHSTESSTTMPPASSFFSTHVTNDTSTETTTGPMSATGSTARSMISSTTDTTTLTYTSGYYTTPVMTTATSVMKESPSHSGPANTGTTDNINVSGDSTILMHTSSESPQSTESSTTVSRAGGSTSTHVVNDISTDTTIGPVTTTKTTSTLFTNGSFLTNNDTSETTMTPYHSRESSTIEAVSTSTTPAGVYSTSVVKNQTQETFTTQNSFTISSSGTGSAFDSFGSRSTTTVSDASNSTNVITTTIQVEVTTTSVTTNSFTPGTSAKGTFSTTTLMVTSPTSSAVIDTSSQTAGGHESSAASAAMTEATSFTPSTNQTLQTAFLTGSTAAITANDVTTGLETIPTTVPTVGNTTPVTATNSNSYSSLSPTNLNTATPESSISITTVRQESSQSQSENTNSTVVATTTSPAKTDTPTSKELTTTSMAADTAPASAYNVTFDVTTEETMSTAGSTESSMTSSTIDTTTLTSTSGYNATPVMTTAVSGDATTLTDTSSELPQSIESSTTVSPAGSSISTHVINDTSTETTISPKTVTKATSTLFTNGSFLTNNDTSETTITPYHSRESSTIEVASTSTTPAGVYSMSVVNYQTQATFTTQDSISISYSATDSAFNSSVSRSTTTLSDASNSTNVITTTIIRGVTTTSVTTNSFTPGTSANGTFSTTTSMVTSPTSSAVIDTSSQTAGGHESSAASAAMTEATSFAPSTNQTVHYTFLTLSTANITENNATSSSKTIPTSAPTVVNTTPDTATNSNSYSSLSPTNLNTTIKESSISLSTMSPSSSPSQSIHTDLVVRVTTTSRARTDTPTSKEITTTSMSADTAPVTAYNVTFDVTRKETMSTAGSIATVKISDATDTSTLTYSSGYGTTPGLNVINNLNAGDITIDSISLSWLPPTGNKSSYLVQVLGNPSSNVTTFYENVTFTDLIPGNLYTFKVSAVGGNGVLGKSSQLSVFTVSNVTNNLNVAVVTIDSISLSWLPPTGNKSFYSVQVLGSPASNVTTLYENISITNLTPGNLYTFKVSAVGGNGVLGNSSLLSEYTVPNVIKNLNVTDITIGSISLNWLPPTGNKSSYLVQVFGKPASNVTTLYENVSITNLIPANLYTFKVSAVAGNGVIGKRNQLLEYTVPNVTSNLIVTDITIGSISLSWLPPTGNKTSYLVQVFGNPDSNVKRLYENVSITNLIPGNLYAFKVSAVGGNGVLGKSILLSEFTVPNVTNNLNVTDITIDSISLSWLPPTGNKSSYLVQVLGNPASNVTTLYENVSITNLIPGNLYTFKVSAVVGNGVLGIHSILSEFTVPNVTNNLNVADITIDSISLSWLPPTGNKSSYFVQVLGNPDSNVTTLYENVSITSLIPGNLYTFKVSAVGGNGVLGNSSLLSEYTVPNVTNNLNVTDITIDSISLSWLPPTGNKSSYFVQVLGNPDSNVTTLYENVSIPNLIPGNLYTFKVSAVGGNGVLGNSSLLSEYTDNPPFCSDINECLNSPCHQNATCANTFGSYTCTCNSGYKGNGTFCCSSECDANRCLNGGTCLLSGARCADQICTCPAGFEGETCSEQSLFFVPVASRANIPKRTVILVLSSIFAFNSTDAECKIQAVLADLPVRGLFYNDSNHHTIFQGGAHLMNVTTQFNYSGVAAEIKYLNEQLVLALNRKIDILRAVTVTKKILLIQVIDGTFTSQADLVPYFSCGAFQPDAYTLNTNTFMCESQCINYCKNSGSCTLTFNGPLCRCVPFSIYTTSGPTCDTITMNLNAFFGILFGALIFLLLLIIAIVLIVYWRRKKKKSEVYECYDDSFRQTSFYKKTLTGYKNVQETKEAEAFRNNPVLVDFKAQSEMGDTSMEGNTGQPQRQSEIIYSTNLER
ncbi:uncharacterized protein LOC144792151 [Lissotriton helveticus]